MHHPLLQRLILCSELLETFLVPALNGLHLGAQIFDCFVQTFDDRLELIILQNQLLDLV